MDFRATPLNVTTLLVVTLGCIAGWFLTKRRFDSNLTIFFYLTVLAYAGWSDRHVNSALYGAGLILALLLRFEFMNPPLTRLVMVLEVCLLAAINLAYLGQVFA